MHLRIECVAHSPMNLLKYQAPDFRRNRAEVEAQLISCVKALAHDVKGGANGVVLPISHLFYSKGGRPQKGCPWQLWIEPAPARPPE